jgi:hypothetical protein
MVLQRLKSLAEKKAPGRLLRIEKERTTGAWLLTWTNSP